ncbi:MAG: DUF6483 family protein [Eubacteriales bacterium]|nr:DUF6483 family protein [Eubacteriales bacterium]
MFVEDEKDYMMRMIKEMTRVLISVLLGRQMNTAEFPPENQWLVSGSTLDDFEKMVDRGEINEAENMLLENLDYTNKQELLAALYFYGYIGEKDESFLQKHNYSTEEALDGIRQLAEDLGFDHLF